MSARIEFAITEDEHDMLVRAMQPVPYMVFGGMEPRSPQENANDAYKVIAETYGVEWMSILPVGGGIPFRWTGVSA